MLGNQWNRFESCIVLAINRLLDLWLIEINEYGVKETSKITDQLEGCSLIFLCSVNPAVRKSAIDIMSKSHTLTTNNRPTDDVLEKENDSPNFSKNWSIPSLKRPLKTFSGLVPHNSRFFLIFRKIGPDLVKRHYSDLKRASFPTKEDEIRDKQYRKYLFSNEEALFHIAGSNSEKDIQIWTRCFPDVARAIFEYGYVRSIAFAFRQLLNCIHILSPTILQSSDSGSKISTGTIKWSAEKFDKKLTTVSEELIEQWSFYCILTVSVSGIITLEELRLQIGDNIPSELSVETLFNSLLEFFGVERNMVRQTAIHALECVHTCNYKVFLELLEPHMIACAALIKHGYIPNNRKNTNAFLVASQKRSDRQRQDLVYILSFIADFVDFKDLIIDSSFISKFVPFVRHLARFLSIPEIQNEWDHQLLRCYFCGLVGRFYSHLVNSIYHSDGRQHFE